jgi:hypothetical protein
MALIKRRELSEKQLAAIRRNQKLTHGPATAESRDRIRAAHLRHGFYAQAEGIALRSLGEEPDKFQELLEGLWETYNPTDAAQEGLVIRLARATWLMNRADRAQEGCAVRQAQEMNTGRENRLHARMMRLRITADSLRQLAQSVQCDHYVTTPANLDLMKSLAQEGVLNDMGDIALAFFYQLQAPGTGKDGVDPIEQSRRALVRIKEIFGLNSDVPPKPKNALVPSQPEETQRKPVETVVDNEHRYPSISEAEWERRERPRQLLENILKRQVEVCESQRTVMLQESLKGPSPYERAAEIATTHPHTLLTRRLQDSYFREVRRATNLLLKMKRFERKSTVSERDDGECGDAVRQ